LCNNTVTFLIVELAIRADVAADRFCRIAKIGAHDSDVNGGTRLARYVLQELTGWQGFIGGCLATLASLGIPLAFLLLTKEKAYLVAWPIFGASNQLLASLTLLVISVWLVRSGKSAVYTILPMIFMLVTTVCALVLQIKPFVLSFADIMSGKDVKPEVMISGICGVVLLVLGGLSFLTAARSLLVKPRLRRA